MISGFVVYRSHGNIDFFSNTATTKVQSVIGLFKFYSLNNSVTFSLKYFFLNIPEAGFFVTDYESTQTAL